jgi:hypothetical protein
MLTPGLGEWGLGIRVLGAGDRLLFTHEGDDWGFKASLMGWPRDERAIAVMGDGDDAFAVIEPLVQAVVREYGWADGPRPQVIDVAPLTDEQKRQIVGSWAHGALMIAYEGERLIGRYQGRSFEFYPQSPDLYLVAGDGQQPMSMAAIRGADGKITALAGGPVRFERDP